MYVPQLFQMCGNSIRLANKRHDPSAVDQFSTQLLNGIGEATGVKFEVE